MFNLFKRKKPPPLDREKSMKAIPIYNEGIRKEIDGKGLRLTFHKPSRVFGGLVTRLNLPHPEKTLILDELGTYVWKLIDGRRTMQEIIQKFRKEFKANPRESEVSVVEFIRMLVIKGAVSLIFKD